MKYRPEVDGLRALAVLPVILFHAGFELFRGGFVGVDVFLVISGYLITMIITKELDDNNFRLINFYERRARRILPALFGVMLASTPIAILTFTPSDLIDFGESLIAVSLFSSNILFWLESGYFQTIAELKPLLHTWSLAVEEQYYIFFPIFLLVTFRFGINKIIILLGIIFLASFSIAQWGSINSPSANFYLLPSRGWELLIGVFTALYLNYFCKKRPYLLNEFISILGVSLIGYSIFNFNSATPFPSAYTLVPTIGTALIIIGAEDGTFIKRILGTKPLVGIGLISYSAYLWHQPILAFAKYNLGEHLSAFFILTLCLFSIFCAYCSWRWIEAPFRNKNIFSIKKIFLLSAMFSVIFIMAGFFLVNSMGLINKYSYEQKSVLENFMDGPKYTVERFLDHELQNFDSDKIKIIVIGDSHAQDLTNMIYESGLISKISLSTYGIDVKCGVLMIKQEILSTYQESLNCKEKNFYSSQKLTKLIKESDEVWLASSWNKWNLPFMDDSITAIKNINPKIVIFGSKFFGNIKQLDFIRHGLHTWDQFFDLNSEEQEINEFLINFSYKHNLAFKNYYEIICKDYQKCSNTDGKNAFSYDGDHLTPYGASYFGEKFLKN